ncbi:hypothetical protein F5Y09DRAFT_330515 [Xylaria sp. FL1042]|nr:hypothetical protein F5Y09DRAFT_330515 [Xylaria sp. FL1042]
MATGLHLFYCLWQESRIRDTLFEALSNEDIGNVRLANSACCNLVTKRLFLRTHLTFTPSSFTRQARVQALSRIGHYIEHLTFYFPHSNATFLPPLIHPESGREISFLYTPHTSMGSVLERPKFANEGLGEILTSQYPPLFHAASNVPSFINAMKHLVNIRHLTIKTPGQDPKERYRRDIVDYALISLRVALERAPMKKLNKLSLSVHPSAFLYLRPVQGFGCTPSAGRRWKQIRKMHINVDSWDFYGPSPGLDNLKIIQDFLYNYSPSLEKLAFTWHGRKGPCPIALAADPLFAPPRNSLKLFREVTSPMSPLPPAPPRKPVVFRKLRYLAVRNATLNAAQVADIVTAHQHCVREFDFENSVLVGEGTWDDALAPLMSSNSHSGYWTRHSMATVTEITCLRSNRPEDVYEPEPQPSAAVEAVTRQLYNNGFEEAEDEVDYVDYEEHPEEFEVELDSDVEAARQASLSAANKIKKRTVTKRRRKRKPGHERRDDKGEERHRHHHRGRHRQASHGSLEEPHEVRRLHFPWLKRSKECPTTPPQPSYGGLFGEVDSVYSTDSRRLFGEVTPLSHSRTGSEPDLTHSPSDDPDSGDDYMRPRTPATPIMKISSPILDTSPNMPTLLQPKVYDPTAELCSEITAVQRDLEAEEKHRRFAEDAEMQTNALRRAKELVLTRLGKEFSANNYGAGNGGRLSPKKETFGAPFLNSTRFREGLFGKNNGQTYNSAASTIPDHRSMDLLDATWLYLRPSGLHRYLYADETTGQRAWALVTGSTSGIGKSLAFELAAHGFNVVLHGRNPAKLATVKAELLLASPPGVEVRVLVADASQCHRPDAVDFARIRDELAELHLTVLINCAGSGPTPAFGVLESYDGDAILDSLHLNTAFPTLLTAALLPVLRGEYRKHSNPPPDRNLRDENDIGAEAGGGVEGREAGGKRPSRPALIINIGSVTDDGFPLVAFYSAGKAATHTLHRAIAREAQLDGWARDVEIVSHRVGAVTGVSHTVAPASLLRPDARTIARAVLGRTGCGRSCVVPYWPHAVLQVFLGLVPGSLCDWIVNGAMRGERRAQDEGGKRE